MNLTPNFSKLSVDNAFQNATQAKRRIFWGISIVMLLIVIGFSFEAYFAAVRFGLKVELTAQRSATDLLTDELIEEIKAHGFEEVDFEHLLYHVDGSYFLALIDSTSGKALASEAIQIEASDKESLDLFLTAQDLNFFTGLRDYEKLRTHGAHITNMDVESAIRRIGGKDYGVMAGDIGPAVFVSIRPVDAYRLAVQDVLLSLLSSSLILLWVGIWGGYAVAVYISKRVEESNRALIRSTAYDSTTGLPNIRGIEENLLTDDEVESPVIPGQPDANGRLFLIAVRNYHQIKLNHTYEIAESMMSAVSAKMRDMLNDQIMMARIDNETFAAFCPRSMQSESQRLLETMTQELVEFDHFCFPIEASVAMVDYPAAASELNELIRLGYGTLREGLRRHQPIVSYQPGIYKSNQQETRYAAEIAQALDEGQFELYYQPKIDLGDGEERIVGAEALVRWNHPEDGLLFPGDFINIVEASNLRRKFSQFVIESCAKTAKEFKDLGCDLCISFNLSSFDTQDLQIIRHLNLVMDQYKLDPGALQVELLESETSIDLEHIQRALQEIVDCGYSVAIDDFGTGMSSLNYVSRLPFDTLKIDRSFIADVDSDHSKYLMLKGIVNLADQFGWDLAAEGIERPEEAKVCQGLGIQQAQGYLYSRPVPLTKFRAFLNEKGCGTGGLDEITM